MSAPTIADARRIARERGDLAPLIACVPYMRWLGVEAAARHEAGARLRLPFTEPLTGSPTLPAIHGGVVASFLECAATLELLLTLDLDRVPKAIDVSIDYLRSARTVTLYADCSIERLGRRVAQTTMRCWQDDPARPVATARAHFLIADAGSEAE